MFVWIYKHTEQSRVVMNLQEKESTVTEVGTRFKGAEFAVLVGYQGCTTAEILELKKKLLPFGAKFSVVKNTLAKRALADTSAAKLSEFFVGPTALVWSGKEAVGPAKVLKDFAKENDKLKIKAGLFGADVLDSKGIDYLASLPSREELLCKLLGLMNAPATKLLQTINAPAATLARLLGAWRDKLENK